MVIKVVMFDLGNTIVRLCTPEIVFQRILHSFNIRRSRTEIRKALKETHSEFRDHYSALYGKIPCKEYWSSWDALVLKNLGIPNYASVSKEIHPRWFDNADCEEYSDARMTLLELEKMGLRKALVSTGYEEDICAILTRARIRKEMFEVIVGADKIQRVKPDPAVFTYALERLNVEPEEALFVGDKKKEDFEGAKRVGMNSLLLQRTMNRTLSVPNAQTINTLTEILERITEGIRG